MLAEPQAEHKWLEQLVGDWTYESEAVMGPDQPPMKYGGTESVRSLGGMWMLCEGQGEMPGGGTMLTLMSLGYDTAKKTYTGSFIGSMMTHLWIYTSGEVVGDVLTLHAEGPSMSGDGKLTKYQDILDLSGGGRVLKSRILGADGQWTEFMKAVYTRKK